MFQIRIKTKDFDFFKTFNSGLFYFFYEDIPVRRIYFNNRIIELVFRQEGGDLIIDSSDDLERNEIGTLKDRTSKCFGLNENLKDFYALCKKDKVLRDYLPKIKKTRIVSAFSDFEALVGAIVSQNNSYKNYRKQMRKVYRKVNFVPINYKEKQIKNLHIGYKIAYIMDLSRNFDKLDIKDIKGIGDYSINLFNIFQKREYDSFYVDCLTEKIMRENYDISSDFEENSKKLWGKYRGLAEAYLQRFFEQK
jgi:3-methyladenine DNA glycosylase/8-oxoguanine DNA glycosylase